MIAVHFVVLAFLFMFGVATGQKIEHGHKTIIVKVEHKILCQEESK